MGFLEVVKVIATIATCITAVGAAIALLLKPLKKQTDAIKQLSNDIQRSQANSLRMAEKLENLSERVDENEKDRLRAELADYATRCRHGEHLYEAEFEHVQAIYEKYHDVLGGNSRGTSNYKFIVDYYNDQCINGK